MADAVSSQKFKELSVAQKTKIGQLSQKNQNDDLKSQKAPAKLPKRPLIMNKQQSFDPSAKTGGIFNRYRTTYSLSSYRSGKSPINSRPVSAKSLDNNKHPHSICEMERSGLSKVLPVIDDTQSASGSILINDCLTMSTLTCNNSIGAGLQQQHQQTIHKPGQIPSYLGKPSRYTIEAEFNLKRKAFTTAKRNLVQEQTNIMDMYKALIELQQKVNKSYKKHYQVEKLQLVAFDPDKSDTQYVCESTQRVDAGTGVDQSQTCVAKKKSESLHLRRNEVELIEEQMRTIQNSSLGVCVTIVEQSLSALAELNSSEPDHVTETKEKIGYYHNDLMKAIKNVELEQNEAIKNSLVTLETFVKENRKEKKGKLNVELKAKVESKDKEILSLQHELSEVKSRAVTLKADLKESDDRYCKVVKDFENKFIELEGVKSQDDTLRRTNAHLRDEHKKKEKEVRTLTDRLRNETDRREKVERKFQELGEKYNELQKQNEKNKDLKIQIEGDCRSKMDHELHEAKKMMEQHFLKERTKESAEAFQCIEGMKESFESSVVQIETLKADIALKDEQIGTIKEDLRQEMCIRIKLAEKLANYESSAVEQRIRFEDNERKSETIKRISELLKNETEIRLKAEQELREACANMEGLKHEIEHYQKGFVDRESELRLMDEMKTNMRNQEKRLIHQSAVIAKLEHILKNQSQELSDEQYQIQKIIKEFKDSETLKIEEIGMLKKQLSKAENQIKEQEETLFEHQQCLRVRGELIETLKQSDQTTQCRMIEAYQEIHKKNTMMDRMETEVSAKAEELQNIFSTLTTKQMKVMRQEKIIEMLEANAERSRKIRARQLDKISALESENVKLRTYLAAERETIVDVGASVTDETSLENCDGQLNQSLFDQERRTKRTNQILVKRY